MGSGQMNVLLIAFLKQHSLTASHKAVSFVVTPASLLEIIESTQENVQLSSKQLGPF